MRKDNEKKQKKGVWYFLGSIAVAAGMCIIMPKLIENGSDMFYEKKPTPPTNSNDDWGPEIVKKEEIKEKENGKI